MIRVLKPGLETTVQDHGRYGYYSIAFPPSGAMDFYSYTLGNLLVGNAKTAASLEITYLGPELEFLCETIIAITGAELPPKINGVPVPQWEAIRVKNGDLLSFDHLKSGARAYVAVAGGIETPPVMGSRSTYSLSGIGGYEGRSLKQGDMLPIGNMNNKSVTPGVTIPAQYTPHFRKTSEIRVLVGLCSYRFTEESKSLFFQTEWLITPDANRVGYRLKGERLAFVPREQPFGAGSNPSNVIDNFYPVGSIQIPDGIEPIVLLRDAVTAGGFVTLGSVITADLNIMAQAKTNEKIHFTAVTIEQALAAQKEMMEKIKQVEERI